MYLQVAHMMRARVCVCVCVCVYVYVAIALTSDGQLRREFAISGIPENNIFR